MMNKKLCIVSAILSAAALSGCNGGGGGGGGDTGSPAVSAGDVANVSNPPVWEFFQDNNNLYAVNRTSDNPTPLVVAATNSTAVPHWMFQTATLSGSKLQDLKGSSFVYISNGSFYKVAANQNVLGSPVKVSSESSATKLCSSNVATLFEDSTRPGAIIYSVPATAGGTCNNATNVTKKITLDMSQTSAPLVVSAAQLSADAYYSTTSMNPLGYLSAEDGYIYNNTPTFTSKTKIDVYQGARTVTSLYTAGIANNGQYTLVSVQSAPKTTSGPSYNELFAFDPVSGNMTNLQVLGSVGDTYQVLGSVGGYTYFVGPAFNIYRIKSNNPGAAEKVVTTPATNVKLVGDYVFFFQKNATGKWDLKNMNVTQPSAQIKTLLTLNQYRNVIATADHLFTSEVDATGKFTNRSWAISADGNNVQALTGIIVGASAKPQLDMNGANYAVQNVFLAKDVIFSANTMWSGGTVSVLNPSTLVTEGTPIAGPATAYGYGFWSGDYNNVSLGGSFTQDMKGRKVLILNKNTSKIYDVATDNSAHGWLSDFFSGN